MTAKHQVGQRRVFPRLSVRGPVRRLTVVFGDQLDPQARSLTCLDKRRDAVAMFEVAGESTLGPSHRQRTGLFLSAMRHFALDLHRRKYRIHYVRLDAPGNIQSLQGELQRALRALRPEEVLCTQPGSWRVQRSIERAAKAAEIPLQVLPDEHFLVRHQDFSEWMAGRKQPVMEHFYRRQRRTLGVLVDPRGEPAGGDWNYDKENRGRFSQPPHVPRPYVPRPDEITLEVLDLVGRRFSVHPGSLRRFRWPVTRAQAVRALRDFVEKRLPDFGTYQDAMWSGEPFLYHSLLSVPLNLKLLRPLDCVAAAVRAYEAGAAPLNCVEGFVRQIIGWREFIRGIYWHEGPDYGARNELEQDASLPSFYWTGDTDMVCLRECLGQVLEYGYGHHIQRLMVTGNFALIAGLDPCQISDWYLAMYVDAVDWVTLPNTIGMVMHADGGIVGTKPYAASGRYIQRMSNYCTTCRYEPERRTGDRACPFTTFYWDFLIRMQQRFRHNRRMAMMLQHVDRIGRKDRKEIGAHAEQLREAFGIGLGS
jgi:deoxyribodipyrimidine photolyase-related protein